MTSIIDWLLHQAKATTPRRPPTGGGFAKFVIYLLSFKFMQNNSYVLPVCFLPKKVVSYKIALERGTRHVYMCHPPEYSETHVPVTVHTDRFLAAWADAPRHDDGQFKIGVPFAKCKEIWHLDRRLNEGHAEEGFSRMMENPVPFAAVNTFSEGKLFLLNGITRTLWLLIHNVWAFPLACPNSLAAKLESACGV